ncbi:Endoglucanase [Phytophthora megakarya]|uniref:Endoglucanase n=1 Tax=Phytophthora megakarya TaxID=4795 RepID=A0A225WRK2_9STRA|nr:Endoglucanase [Phytophthora megakarya]
MKLFNSALVLSLIGSATAWWKPTPGTSYQIQLSGTLDLSYNVDMYDIDMYDTPNATIAELQQRGIKVICYFSAGTYEDWRSDKDRYSFDIIGTALPEWEGESWVDIRSSKLREIIEDRMKFAKAKGCDGVDPDNVDGAFNDNGFDLTADDQLDFNKFLATTAHGLDLSVGLKNDLDQIDDLVADFDFSVNEQCVEYNECDTLVPFIKADKPVFGIEYSGDKVVACATANSLDFDTLFKTLSLQSERYSCRELSEDSSLSSSVVSSTEGSKDQSESSNTPDQQDTDVEGEADSSQPDIVQTIAPKGCKSKPLHNKL